MVESLHQAVDEIFFLKIAPPYGHPPLHLLHGETGAIAGAVRALHDPIHSPRCDRLRHTSLHHHLLQDRPELVRVEALAAGRLRVGKYLLDSLPLVLHILLVLRQRVGPLQPSRPREGALALLSPVTDGFRHLGRVEGAGRPETETQTTKELGVEHEPASRRRVFHFNHGAMPRASFCSY